MLFCAVLFPVCFDGVGTLRGEVIIVFQQAYTQSFREKQGVLDTYPHYPQPPVRNFGG